MKSKKAQDVSAVPSFVIWLVISMALLLVVALILLAVSGKLGKFSLFG